MRSAGFLLLALALGACASASPEGGIANYDTLARAQADCAAKGGEFALKNGGDPQVLIDYACKRK